MFISVKIHLNSAIHSDRRRQWHPTPVLLPGKSHGWRSLVVQNKLYLGVYAKEDEDVVFVLNWYLGVYSGKVESSAL